ncbi:unnamed protein product [Zymoseptoria tritici ST99CH_1A5]|uniref:beta-glucosidase n=1 Tax=Zymoseptoria tritici ST99CH_1A5 TaxID=1276529 RepID=A0A1Y6M2X6_ZYMTR|nr:unnamed protein product [Zymoseptoria tritici ST99CH_1A5]
MRPTAWLAVASWVTLGHGQNTTSFSADAIEAIIRKLHLLSDDLAEAGAQKIAAFATTAQKSIDDTLKSSWENGTLSDERKLTDPEAFYSYGWSPPIYPSPQGQGSGDWSTAYDSARALVSQMTVAEKVNLTIPAGDFDFAGCTGFSGTVPRLGFSGLCLMDGPAGLRGANTPNVSGFPPGVSIGASFNRTLSYLQAHQLGVESRAKGVNVVFSPMVGPLGRIAKGGRNWEGYSNDAYLAGQMVYPAIKGLQENVIATVKHFIGNEQETLRKPYFSGLLQPAGVTLYSSVSSNIDDQTMHELYLWPFYDAVKAGAGSVMSSYNRLNNSWASQNSKLLNGLLKTELGFQGFALTDWSGQHTGVASANAGQDMVMPRPTYWGYGQLEAAVNNGSVDITRLDDMATRIVASMSRFANISNPGIDYHNDTDPSNKLTTQVLLEAAIQGHVLVKNGGILPLRAPKVLSLFGYDAVSGMNTSAEAGDFYDVCLGNSQYYADGRNLTVLELSLSLAGATSPTFSFPSIAQNGTLIAGGGSGGSTPSYMVSPYDAIVRQAASDDTTLFTDFSEAPAVLEPTNPCLVFINTQSVESADRTELADEYSDNLVLRVADQCANTIVIIHNAGIRLVDEWIDHDNVTAVVYAHLPGQASGDALVSILYGDTSPSGRLPYTIAKRESDYDTLGLLNPTLPTAEDPQYAQSNFSEGLLIDYRAFLAHNITPRYPFGFGLTYSEFAYSDLTITQHCGVDRSALPPDASEYDSRPHPEGGLESLYDILTTVAVSVHNIGNFTAAETAQLYLSVPGRGMVLRGFEKQMLQPGEKQKFHFDLRRRDFSVWDVEKQHWFLQEGEYEVMVGRNVLDEEGLKDSFEL